MCCAVELKFRCLIRRSGKGAAPRAAFWFLVIIGVPVKRGGWALCNPGQLRARPRLTLRPYDTRISDQISTSTDDFCGRRSKIVAILQEMAGDSCCRRGLQIGYLVADHEATFPAYWPLG